MPSESAACPTCGRDPDDHMHQLVRRLIEAGRKRRAGSDVRPEATNPADDQLRCDIAAGPELMQGPNRG